MIEPTVGRIVWVFASSEQKQPLPAIITSVISNTEITVTIFDLSSERHQKLPLSDHLCEVYPFACWMPYQKSQAAKYDQLEKELKK